MFLYRHLAPRGLIYRQHNRLTVALHVIKDLLFVLELWPEEIQAHSNVWQPQDSLNNISTDGTTLTCAYFNGNFE